MKNDEIKQTLIRVLISSKEGISQSIHYGNLSALSVTFSHLETVMGLLERNRNAQSHRFIETIREIKAKILVVTSGEAQPSHLTNSLHLIDDMVILISQRF